MTRCTACRGAAGRGWPAGPAAARRSTATCSTRRCGLPEDELAVLCVLMLRGPQTPGELKQRTERLHPLADLAAVLDALERLIGRDLAARLARRPGQKEERYTHLLGEDEAEAEEGAPAASARQAPAAPAPQWTPPRAASDSEDAALAPPTPSPAAAPRCADPRPARRAPGGRGGRPARGPRSPAHLARGAARGPRRLALLQRPLLRRRIFAAGARTRSRAFGPGLGTADDLFREALAEADQEARGDEEREPGTAAGHQTWCRRPPWEAK